MEPVDRNLVRLEKAWTTNQLDQQIQKCQDPICPTDHIVGHKTSLNKFKRIQVKARYIIWPNHNANQNSWLYPFPVDAGHSTTIQEIRSQTRLHWKSRYQQGLCFFWKLSVRESVLLLFPSFRDTYIPCL